MLRTLTMTRVSSHNSERSINKAGRKLGPNPDSSSSSEASASFPASAAALFHRSLLLASEGLFSASHVPTTSDLVGLLSTQ